MFDMADVLKVNKKEAKHMQKFLFKVMKRASSVLLGIQDFVEKMTLKTQKQRNAFYAGFILGRFIERNEIAAAILNQINNEEDKSLNTAAGGG